MAPKPPPLSAKETEKIKKQEQLAEAAILEQERLESKNPVQMESTAHEGLHRRRVGCSKETGQAKEAPKVEPKSSAARSASEGDGIISSTILILFAVTALGIAVRVYFAVNVFSVLHADEFFQVTP